MNEKYWIKIEADEDVIDKMETTLIHCQKISNWAIEAFKDFWLREKRLPYANGISKNVSDYISRNKVYSTQRFTMNKTVDQALKECRSYLITVGDQVELQIPALPVINEFKIAPRKIWIKYMEDSGYISTYYGRLYLTGEWLGVIGNQLSDHRISYGLLPYLWHSVSIKREGSGEDVEWLMRINFHNTNSYQGKRARKEYREKIGRKKEKHYAKI